VPQDPERSPRAQAEAYATGDDSYEAKRNQEKAGGVKPPLQGEFWLEDGTTRIEKANRRSKDRPLHGHGFGGEARDLFGGLGAGLLVGLKYVVYGGELYAGSFG
jgi:hypothetical protein